MNRASHVSERIGGTIVYIDMAYDLAELERQGRLSFIDARNRGRIFDRVISVHPVAGLTEGQSAGRVRIRHVGSRNLVIDGYYPLTRGAATFKILNLFYSQLRMVAVLRRLARDPSVRVIAAADIFYLGLLAIVAGYLAGKPVSVAAYQNQDEIYENSGRLAFPRLLPARRLEKLVQRFVLRRAQLIEAPTENMRGYLERNGAPPDRIRKLTIARTIAPGHLIPPDNRPDPAPLLRKYGLDAGAPRMVMISRLIELKFVRDGVEAMMLACHRIPSAVGIVLGEGELAGELAASVAAAGLSDRIVFLGKLNQADLGAVIRSSVVVSPLTGMALVEASLAGGVPVVYDRDWQPEFVVDGLNGFVVPFRNVEAMAGRCAELLQDPVLFDKMSQAARDAGCEFADPILVHQREAAIFTELCRERKGSRA